MGRVIELSCRRGDDMWRAVRFKVSTRDNIISILYEQKHVSRRDAHRVVIFEVA